MRHLEVQEPRKEYNIWNFEINVYRMYVLQANE
jgi:hypothetical protein